MTCGPVGEPAKAKFRPPTKSSCNRSKADLEYATRAVLGADMVDENDFTARPGDANEFAESGLGLRHRCDDKLSYHDIEGSVRQRHPLGVHHRQRFDVAESKLGDSFMRLAQHRLRQIDADETVFSCVVRE